MNATVSQMQIGLAEGLAVAINQFADAKEKHDCDQQEQDGDPGDG